MDNSLPVIRAPPPIVEHPLGVEHNLQDGQRRLYEHKLQHPLFAQPHKSPIDWYRRQAAGPVEPRGLQLIAVHLDFYRARAADIGQAEGQEIVDDESLVTAAG